jgi:hypothetical protein
MLAMQLQSVIIQRTRVREMRLTVTKLTDYHIMHIVRVRLLDSGLWISHQLLSVTVL